MGYPNILTETNTHQVNIPIYVTKKIQNKMDDKRDLPCKRTTVLNNSNIYLETTFHLFVWERPTSPTPITFFIYIRFILHINQQVSSWTKKTNIITRDSFKPFSKS